MRLRFPIFMTTTLQAGAEMSVFDHEGSRVGDGLSLQQVNLVIKFYMESAYTYTPMLERLPAEWSLKRHIVARTERLEPLSEHHFADDETDSGSERDDFSCDELFKAGKTRTNHLVKSPAARARRQLAAAIKKDAPTIGGNKPRSQKRKR